MAAQNEPKSGVPLVVYLQAGLEIGSAIPYGIHLESNKDSHDLGPQRSPCHSAWRQSKLGPQLPKWQNRPQSLWASTLTKVAPLRPRGLRTMVTNIHNTHFIYRPLVHASGVHDGAEHGARRAENVENCSKWPKMRTLMVGANEAHARLGLECAIGLVSSHMRPTYLLGVAQTPPVLGMAGSPSEPVIWDCPKSPTWRPRHAKTKGSCSPGPRYVGHQSVYLHNILES